MVRTDNIEGDMAPFLKMDRPGKQLKYVPASAGVRAKLFDSKGVTLVEVITVLIIISLLALFAAPEISNWRPRMRLKDQSDQLFGNMQKAKIHALKNNVDVEFTFTIGTGSPCSGGSYSFHEVLIPANIVASGTMTEGVCLSASTFSAGEGVNTRGLTINGAGGVATVKHGDVGGVWYEITLSVAGGVSIDKKP